MIVAAEPGSFCSVIAKLSSLAFSSLKRILPYSSNLRAIGFGGLTCVLQEFVVEHDGSAPPRLTVAVTVWLPSPAVSTVMLDVPWPLLIVPADTDQLKVGAKPSGPPVTEA